jgi:hypothetical protein
MPNNGLDREFKFFNRLERSVCTTCAPGDPKKSSDGQCEYTFCTGAWPSRVGDTTRIFRGWEKRDAYENISIGRGAKIILHRALASW